MSDEKWGAGLGARDAKPFARAFLGGGPVLQESSIVPVDLIFGEHPHSRRENNEYARFADGEVVPFAGHRHLWSVVVDESNYLKESELSGDEVRRSCTVRVYLNGFAVHEISCRDAAAALLKAHHFLTTDGAMEGGSSAYLKAVGAGEPGRLLGMPVYYRDHPAVIDGVIPEQGCLVLRPADGAGPFPRPCWMDDYDDDGRDSVKTEFNSPDIWWHRTADDKTGE